MKERGDMVATVLASVALIVAIMAGVLAWMAYDHTGANLDKRIQDQVNQSAQGMKSSLQGSSMAPSGSMSSSNQDGTAPSDTSSSTNTGTTTVPQTQP